ncbi:hypothetical protein IU470_08620 [Nocardia abscessus]|uniref:Uncharacterized protein n=1 Tax=Nocardia abscessus TaxID=120957 RepID=A0ABS0C456_9NOCA|nr:hypothetical protein [Nocardia abscessus]
MRAAFADRLAGYDMGKGCLRVLLRARNYRAALELAGNDQARRFLARRLAECESV